VRRYGPQNPDSKRKGYLISQKGREESAGRENFLKGPSSHSATETGGKKNCTGMRGNGTAAERGFPFCGNCSSGESPERKDESSSPESRQIEIGAERRRSSYIDRVKRISVQ